MLVHILKSEEILGKIEQNSQTIKSLSIADFDISNQFAVNFILDLLTRLHHLIVITLKTMREGHWFFPWVLGNVQGNKTRGR